MSQTDYAAIDAIAFEALRQGEAAAEEFAPEGTFEWIRQRKAFLAGVKWAQSSECEHHYEQLPDSRVRLCIHCEAEYEEEGL